ncbi:hypothetical protein ABW19_dt0210220 [Dactylella cylindrospora]|nr:hypothetical protein ABW19_dt0210220 [Dactylella cylindrospora]
MQTQHMSGDILTCLGEVFQPPFGPQLYSRVAVESRSQEHTTATRICRNLRIFCRSWEYDLTSFGLLQWPTMITIFSNRICILNNGKQSPNGPGSRTKLPNYRNTTVATRSRPIG